MRKFIIVLIVGLLAFGSPALAQPNPPPQDDQEQTDPQPQNDQPPPTPPSLCDQNLTACLLLGAGAAGLLAVV